MGVGQALKDWSAVNRLLFPAPRGAFAHSAHDLAGSLAWLPRGVEGDADLAGRLRSAAVRAGAPAEMAEGPGDAGGGGDAALAADAGVGDHARSVPCLVVPSPHGRARAVVIFTHGNASDIGFAAPSLQRVAATMNAHVLAPEYPGYGPTVGAGGDQTPSESGIDAAVVAAYRFATTVLRFPPESIILFGRSIGTGAAARCAADPATPVGGLILVSPYTSVVDEIAHVAGKVAAALVAHRWRPLRDVSRMRRDTPLLICHGEADRLIPPEMGREIDAKAREVGIRSEFIGLPGLDHNDADFDRDVAVPARRFFAGILDGDGDGDGAIPEPRMLGVPSALFYPAEGAVDDGAAQRARSGAGASVGGALAATLGFSASLVATSGEVVVAGVSKGAAAVTRD